MSSPADIQNDKHRWLVLTTVIVGTFLGRLDQTIVNLALPHIINDFSITVTAAGWIATAYILANAIFVPVWGKFSDTVGRKKVYVLGFIGFLIGSALAGLAWNLPSMIVFRVIQAIAGSADYPSAMAILAVTFTQPKERAQALGLWSSSFAAATVFGPLLGGPLIDAFSWRAIFLINIPVGLIGLFMALAFVRESVSEKKSLSFDWGGSIILGISLSALVLVLDKGVSWGWLSGKSIVSYVVALISMITFIIVERRHPEPVVDFKFFKIPVFINTLANNFFVFMGMMGSVFLIPLFAQNFLGYTATEAGYLFMPMAFALMIAAPLGGRLIGKIDSRVIMFVSTLGAAGALYLFTSLDPKSTSLDIMIPLSLMAFALGFGMAQRTNGIASSVPAHEIGIASSILALARNIAGAFGIALFGTLLTSSTESHVLSLASHSALSPTASVVAHNEFISLITLKAQIEGYHTVFIAAALLIAAASFLTILMPMPSGESQTKQEVLVLD